MADFQDRVKHPGDGDLTIEDVAAQVEDIRREIVYMVPFSLRDEFGKLGPGLQK